MKSLIFLLFITFESSSVRSSIIYPVRLIGNYCIGGKIENGNCKCPDGTVLFGKECEICYNDHISYFEGNNYKFIKGSQCFIALYNNSCNAEFQDNQIREENSGKRIEGNTFVNYRIRLRSKPIIYLYPKETMNISVQINIKNSKFTTIYPKFNGKNAWNVRAKPNGDILIKDKTYPYLFWEAESYSPEEINEGFIVSEENAEKFLEEKLEIFGLNDKEKTDFITFWLPVLLKNKLSLCSFQSKQFFDDFELNITPKPDSLIRIFITIKKLDAPININEQRIVSNERKGFTVIEWGGSKY